MHTNSTKTLTGKDGSAPLEKKLARMPMLLQIAITKKANRTMYNVWYSCRTKLMTVHYNCTITSS